MTCEANSLGRARRVAWNKGGGNGKGAVGGEGAGQSRSTFSGSGGQNSGLAGIRTVRNLSEEQVGQSIASWDRVTGRHWFSSAWRMSALQCAHWANTPVSLCLLAAAK